MKRPQFTLGACRLSPEQLDHLQALWDANDQIEKFARERCYDMAEPIGPPGDAWVQVLDMMETSGGRPKAAHPEWLSPMCHSRAWFHGCAIRWKQDNEWRFAKFNFALENPLIVGLCELELVDRETASIFFDFQPNGDLNEWKHAFHIVPLAFLFTDAPDAMLHSSVIEVLPACYYQRGGFLTSDSEWMG